MENASRLRPQVENRLISKLTKPQLLSLPGMNGKNRMTVVQLRAELKRNMQRMKVQSYGARVNDYVNAFRNEDNTLFKRMTTRKQNQIQSQKERAQKRETIKSQIIEERQFLNSINTEKLYSSKSPERIQEIQNKRMNQEYYKSNAIESKRFLNSINSKDLYQSKTSERIEYEKRVKDVKNNTQYQDYRKQFMINVNNRVGFEVAIGDDDDKRIAFTETLRSCYKIRDPNLKIIVKAYNLNDSYKFFTLSSDYDMNNTIGHIAGTIDLNTDSSDENPYVDNVFAPVRYEIIFLTKGSKGKRNSTFTVKKQDSETKQIYEEEVEIDEDYRGSPDGGFFPYINLSTIDLTDFQIFNSIDSKNYTDNCFVYACIKSGVFTKDEINHLRYTVRTRSIPNNKILDISKQFKCHFIIRRIDESKDIQHQQKMNIDTRTKKWAKNFKRTVELLLYKDHYMIYKPIPVTTYYLRNQKKIDEKYANVPIENRQLIRGETASSAKYANEGTLPMKIFRQMFELNLFREIKDCEMDILGTCEYDNHLNDYTDLNYDETLCCQLIDNKTKEPQRWTEIYYSDFETDVTVSPHKPYLNCTVRRSGNEMMFITFVGDTISNDLLNYLKDGSLTYFHNLKYDACFFINTPGWEVRITERTGTILQLILTKYSLQTVTDQNGKSKTIRRKDKTLTFRNSYSIIPAPLKSFADMFHLNVHKEVMAYKLYTERNIKRGNVSALEFQLQYYFEKKNELSFAEIKSNWKQLIENAKIAKAYDEDNLTINIMRYAIFYCKKDCVVLMKGMEKFNEDIQKVFKETKTNMLSVHNYISISSIGYNFAESYGCFNGCYLLSGKPANFIQRCVSGGRTMTANNEKQYIEGRIQDFDAVSLYPSAMSIMNGVAKGIPKIIPDNTSTEQLLKFDTFFAEINITKISCKSKYQYKFGQLFRKNDAGSKIFDNQPVERFYIDKIAFKDLIEFYDFDYELIRGYYFDEGFNTKIRTFIKKLFDLRLKYKKEKNPLQSTIKLLLNSIYGKSILKAIETETKCIPKDKMFGYIWKNYNYIKEVVDEPSIENVYVKKVKPINNHFNLPQFGASVLSWSKHIMNQVMATAEQNGINIYYQDTDSMHLLEDDVKKIGDIFFKKYHRTLIGEKMCQFHNDFDSFEGSVGQIHSRKLIALGKKSYLDILVDEKGNEGYHIRMKGVPKQVILNKCKRMDITVEELYERMYNGESMTFNLLDGCNCFRKSKCYQQVNLSVFERTLRF